VSVQNEEENVDEFGVLLTQIENDEVCYHFISFSLFVSSTEFAMHIYFLLYFSIYFSLKNQHSCDCCCYYF